MPSESTVDPNRNRRRNRWLAVAFGLVIVVGIEGVLRLGGWGRVDRSRDPFVGFAAVEPLFVRRGDRFEIPESRQPFFRPESFAAVKPPNGYRAFVLGGSTVQGRPYSTETSFGTWLELSLSCADPQRTFEVVNCGGISYASYRLVPILREVLAYSPDLVILYTGHNEFLEERTYGDLKARAGQIGGLHRAMTNVRLYNVMRDAWVGLHAAPEPDVPELRTEVDALLDHRGGLEAYQRDDEWRQGVVAHYAFNVRRMIEMARDAGVPILVCRPGGDLRDTPPFKTQPGAGLTPAERDRFATCLLEADSLDIDNATKIGHLEAALAIDPRHARTWFTLGGCYLAARRFAAAQRVFARARDEDVCPLRMTGPLHAALARVIDATGVRSVDVRSAFARLSDHGIPGAKWFVDHVHPSIDGHQRIADWILAELISQAVVAPVADHAQRRQARYRRHFRALPENYYIRGRQRLNGLRLWSQGRALGGRLRTDGK